MKKFNTYIACIAVFALLFTSCSKDDENNLKNSDTATISFGPILNDLLNSRQAEGGDIPGCSDGDAAFVSIILSQDGTQVVGSTDDPFEINLVDNQLFTEDVPELELQAGDYTLDYFEVYDAQGNLLWVAPRTGGDLAGFVDNPLPLDVSLGVGVKKYVEVNVICFDDRLVNEYGYLFFELDANQAIEFCIFGNYCPPDEGGRHFPAEFSVDVWMYEDGQRGTQLYDDLSNSVTLNEFGDYAGTPLCVALPDTDGLDEYYFEVTLLESDAYGDVQERVIRAGVINDDEVKNFFDGPNNLDYYHFREGCDGDDSPPILPDPADDAEHYKACLKPVNNSGAIGFAYLRLEGNVLETTVMATGLESNREHLQHIHENADCDNAGPPILSLDEEDGSWPVASAGFGDIVYHRTFTLGSNGIPDLSTIDPLENRTVNLHGMTVDGSYNAGIVVACGEVDPVAGFDD